MIIRACSGVLSIPPSLLPSCLAFLRTNSTGDLLPFQLLQQAASPVDEGVREWWKEGGVTEGRGEGLHGLDGQREGGREGIFELWEGRKEGGRRVRRWLVLEVRFQRYAFVLGPFLPSVPPSLPPSLPLSFPSSHLLSQGI